MTNIAYLNLKAINAPYQAAIKSALADIVDSGWYLFGSNVTLFEKKWAEYCGAQHCVACSNGLDALRLVLKAWIEMGRLAVGDEVIVPANTYIASILAISDCALQPVLVDPDPETYLITASCIEKAITTKTKALLPVHLYGQCCEMKEIMSLAERHGLLVLEDSAQYHDRFKSDNDLFLTQNIGNAKTFSFYPGKNLGALGDAGAVVTDDAELAEVVRKLSNYGSQKKYKHEFKGVNSRMDEFQAAVLSIKLPDLDRCNLRRIEIAERYSREINNPLIVLPCVVTHHVYHIYPIMCDRRDELQQYLAEKGIQTQIHYPIPPHKQLAYKEWGSRSFPISEAIAHTELSLPCNQAMTDADVTKVIDVINNFK